MSILEDVRGVAGKRLLFLPHAIRQMSRPQRMIGSDEVETVVKQGELIEDYPNDPRGHSCLVLGSGDGGRAVHVVCSPKDDYLAIITAYLPVRANGRTTFEGGVSYGMYSLQRANETRHSAI